MLPIEWSVAADTDGAGDYYAFHAPIGTSLTTSANRVLSFGGFSSSLLSVNDANQRGGRFAVA